MTDEEKKDFFAYLRETRRYTQEQLDAAVAAERERCANVLRYWLTGDKPANGTHEGRCLGNILDGSARPWRPNDSLSRQGGADEA